jgi:hypothetical protein
MNLIRQLMLKLEAIPLHAGGEVMPKGGVSPEALKLSRINPSAAAIDIGSTMLMAAVDPDSSDTLIRSFGTFTRDLHDLAHWLKSCGVTSIAMESTGVYWIPAFEVLEQHGFEFILSMRPMRRMFLNERPMSAMLRGFGNCIPMGCFVEAFALMRRSPRCGPIFGSGSDWWNMRQHIFSICRRR